MKWAITAVLLSTSLFLGIRLFTTKEELDKAMSINNDLKEALVECTEYISECHTRHNTHDTPVQRF